MQYLGTGVLYLGTEMLNLGGRDVTGDQGPHIWGQRCCRGPGMLHLSTKDARGDQRWPYLGMMMLYLGMRVL